ncbi:DUF4291 domain-containing protein [Candidatus Uabimicrobium sp. HlEnr_7]|uniref:DUF4291 domain-containing protein n=1 Tax=Candidatus Uabimicrobium helgolandensis TaxID=3095367 RepID=UPI00355878A9
MNYSIRADYNKKSIVVYQAFREQIAVPALREQKFVNPFSFQRMTWIKPSFLWLMARSNWSQKKGQEYILAVRISLEGWEKALKKGVLTTPQPSIYGSYDNWQEHFSQAQVHIQWDPERNIYGKKSDLRSIQVGISRFLSPEYVNEWVYSIEDYSSLARKIYGFLQKGYVDKAKKLLPKEKPYPLCKKQHRKLIPKN